jgi:hypothetical protein
MKGAGVGRNRGRQPLPPEIVQRTVAETITAMTDRHPAIPADTVIRTVHDAAADLTCATSEHFAASLRRRAHGRLAAMTGCPIAIETSGRVVRS